MGTKSGWASREGGGGKLGGLSRRGGGIYIGGVAFGETLDFFLGAINAFLQGRQLCRRVLKLCFSRIPLNFGLLRNLTGLRVLLWNRNIKTRQPPFRKSIFLSTT